MAKIQSSLNTSLAMTAVDTVKYLAIKVPRSEGAKAVFLLEAEVDPAAPDNVATDTIGVVKAAILLGKQTPSAVEISENGALTTRSFFKIITDTTLGESIIYVLDGPTNKKGMYKISEDEDGTFYITLAVTSSDCVAVRAMGARLDFMIVK